jgi:glycosyltransferase involved in cell wall biosynthesis
MSTPSVAILMATYNGEKFLRAQMDSFAAQTYTNWSLHVSDDGSTDDTRAQIAAFSNDHPAHTITVVDGPRQGYAQNFLSLITSIKTDAAYFAYSDQDDIWEPEKMERAVAWLSTIPAHVPALYGARTLYVSHDDEPLYPSRLFTKPPCFSNALVQSFAGGNTMMMNRAARDLMPISMPIVAHDWWAYLLVSGAGGALYYDPHPCMRYRQHAQNLLGQNISIRAKIARIRGLFSGTFKAWNDVNIAALATLRGKFTPQNQATLDTFAHARQLGLARRIIGLYRSKIHRQTALGNLGLIVAALTNRI